MRTRSTVKGCTVRSEWVSGPMPLADLIDDDRVSLALQAGDKDGVLREIAALLDGQGLDSATVYDALVTREQLASTGVGSGIAIPHGRVAGLSNVRAALGVHRKGVNFDSVDGEPVHVFVAILAPEDQPTQHLKMLADISRRLRDAKVRELILDAPDPASARDALVG